MSRLHFTVQFVCTDSRREELVYRQAVLPKRLNDILEILKRDKSAEIFLNKVSKKDAPNYYDVIKHPMDLGTMARKVPVYRNLGEFKADLDLIWSNCLKYNTADYFIQCAERMHALADRLVYLRSRVYPSMLEEVCNRGVDVAEGRCLLKEAVVHYMDVVGFDRSDKHVLNLLADVAEQRICAVLSSKRQ